MKKLRILSALCALVCTMNLSAQTVLPTDSIQEQNPVYISLQEIQEVVIQTPKIIHKADMDVLYPSKSALENSKNGMQLLRNLMIPTLTVNDVMGTVTAANETVQVRINGRVATISQVKALLPETVKRVEWMDNPGLRYNGANAVLNFIVENPTLGGSLMAEAMPSINSNWGQYNASLKLNKGRSQWSVDAKHQITNNIRRIGIMKSNSLIWTVPHSSVPKRLPVDIPRIQPATFN